MERGGEEGWGKRDGSKVTKKRVDSWADDISIVCVVCTMW